jgi:carbamoyl-phosphate synthase small subunit
MKTYALLVLEDGRCFSGEAVGRSGEALGEVVFNTSMTGYQEILSDPSYCGQIVCFTAPHIGNYGVSSADMQAETPALSGVVLRELSPVVSSWRATGSLDAWLSDAGVVGIAGVDTRALTRHLRQHGAMRAGIFPVGPDPDAPHRDTPCFDRSGRDRSDRDALVARVLAMPPMEGRNLAAKVSTPRPYSVPADGERRHLVAVVDCGVKRGILAQLAARGLRLEVLPASCTAEDVLALRPDGVVFSNGPGDPAVVRSAIATARELLRGDLPLLGICLGHQILALALDGRTYKLRFGHHGGNHPVRDESTGEVWITAQNHGFAVDPESIPGSAVSHVSLYDGTVEGLRLADRPVLAVQFHPEACPGPSDATEVFDSFTALLHEVR